MFKRSKSLLFLSASVLWIFSSSFCAFAENTKTDQTNSSNVSSKETFKNNSTLGITNDMSSLEIKEKILKWVVAVAFALMIFNCIKPIAKIEKSEIKNDLLVKINALKNVKEACKSSSSFANYYLADYYSSEKGYPVNFKFYESPVQFANIRSFDCRSCKKNIIFAGASPWYKNNGRALAVSEIAKELNVGYEVNLECDKEGKDCSGNKHVNFEDIEKEGRNGYDHFLTLRKNGKYIAIAMPCDRKDDNYGKSIVQALLGILEYWQTNGQRLPVYVHCTEGRFRTGDLLSILYLLAGANIDYTKEKFLMSANNYFGKKVARSEERDVGAFEKFLKSVGEKAEKKENALSKAENVDKRIKITRNYLIKNGMEASKINTLVSFINN